MDLPIIAGQVANIGAGITLQMQGLTANQLREAADHVLSRSSFKQAAATIRESLRKSGGYHQAVDEVNILSNYPKKLQVIYNHCKMVETCFFWYANTYAYL